MAPIYPSKTKFIELKRYHNIVPIVRDITNTNHLNPFSIYETVAKNLPNSFLFEGGRDGSRERRYSFIGWDPVLVFKNKGDSLNINGVNQRETINPLDLLQSLIDSEEGGRFEYLDHFYGGYVGYFAYNAVRFLENIEITKKDDLNLPDIYILKIDKVIVFDHIKNIVKIIVCTRTENDYDNAVDIIDDIVKKICKPRTPSYRRIRRHVPDIKTLDMDDFVTMVHRVKRYISDGDIYQANISHRIETEYHSDPFYLYKKLYEINPSPFAFYLNTGEGCIASSSPERLIRVRNGVIDTRPIAGTRRRGRDQKEDTMLSAELLLNEKERAEHIMLIDLERNDISRVCKYGSVSVDEFMTAERYSHVWHIVSNVAGLLKDNIRFKDILKAVFPGGTITGCPKIRCMEIIDETEPIGRGIYTGSFGYIGYNKDIDLNIIIRTVIIKNEKAYFHAGAGIVADSDPKMEFIETMHKAEALIRGISGD